MTQRLCWVTPFPTRRFPQYPAKLVGFAIYDKIVVVAQPTEKAVCYTVDVRICCFSDVLLGLYQIDPRQTVYVTRWTAHPCS